MSKKESLKRINRKWLEEHGFSPLEEVRKRIEGDKYPAPSQGCSVDLEWYKSNGYVSAEEFFAKMRGNYDYDPTVITPP